MTNPKERVLLLCLVPKADEEVLSEMLQMSAFHPVFVHSVENLKLEIRKCIHPIVIYDEGYAGTNFERVYWTISRNNHKPLLLVSHAFRDNRLWAEAINIGVHDMVVKPHSRQQIVAIIQSAFAEWERKTK